MLLHGTGSSLHAWEGWAQALKAQRRVIRYDLAGYGLTGPSPDNIYSLDDDVRLVLAMLDKLKLPTLVLWGGRDRLIPPDDAERFHREIQGSTLAIFEDLGHAPEEEDPTRTVAAVKQFLRME